MPGSCCDILCNVNKSHLAGVRPEHLAKCAYIFSLIDSSVNQPRKHDSVIVHSRAVEKLYDCLTRKSLFKCPLAGAPGETPSGVCTGNAVKYAPLLNRLTISLRV